nr:hypothetical protein [Planomonospora sp. ID82291]
MRAAAAARNHTWTAVTAKLVSGPASWPASSTMGVSAAAAASRPSQVSQRDTCARTASEAHATAAASRAETPRISPIPPPKSFSAWNCTAMTCFSASSASPQAAARAGIAVSQRRMPIARARADSPARTTAILARECTLPAPPPVTAVTRAAITGRKSSEYAR